MIETLSSNRKVITIGIVLTLTLVMTISGCNSTTEREVSDVVDMMKKVPKDCWSFIYMDLDVFRNNADLKDEYTNFTERRIVTTLANFIGGIHEVDSFTVAGKDFGDLNMLFEGNFNLDEVRENIEELSGSHKGEYRGIEVWGEESSAALVSNKLVIIGYVKACIDAMIDSDTSLYGDKNCRDIIERLPGGILFQFQEGALRIQGFYSSYDGLLFSGYSMLKKDKHSMTITSVCKFENSDYASQAMDTVKQDLENCTYEEFRNIEVKQDSEFIEVITNIDIKGCLSDW